LKKQESDHRRNLRIGIHEGLLATPWTFIAVPGNFVVAGLLTQYFGIDKAAYGAIVSLPAWSNALQIILIPWLARFLTPKDLTLGLGWFNVGLWSMLAAVLGYLPTDDARGVAPLFIAFFVLSSLSHSFVGMGWTSWVRDWVPQEVRGSYFGLRNRWLSLVTICYLLLAITFFEVAEAALWPYQALIITAVFMRYGSIIWQYGIRTRTDHSDLVNESWMGHLIECLRAPGLMAYILFSSWVSFWLGFVGPFVPVFSFEELGVDPSMFTSLVILGTVSGILGWAYWGRRADRLGSIPVLAVGLFLWEIQNYLWAVLYPGNVWLLYPMFLWGGFFSVAYFLGSFNLLLNLLPQKTKLAGISLNLAITSIAAGIAPIIAGFLLAYFLEERQGGIEVYRIGFVIKTTAILLGLLILRKIREPNRSGRTDLHGSMRTLRQLLAIQGPGFFSNLTHLNKKKP